MPLRPGGGRVAIEPETPTQFPAEAVFSCRRQGRRASRRIGIGGLPRTPSGKQEAMYKRRKAPQRALRWCAGHVSVGAFLA
jgi:hypothetical protein